MKGRLAADDVGELQVEVVQGFVSHNTEFSVQKSTEKFQAGEWCDRFHV